MSDIHSIAKLALSADLERINTLSHNLANINTNGYKRQVFTLDSALQPQDSANVGGWKLNATQKTDMTQGPLKQTGRALDLAVYGQGFFLVGDTTEPMLTRRGDFMVDSQGYIALPTGERLIAEGGHVSVTSSDVLITDTGDIMHEGALLDRLALVEPMSVDSLQYLGAGQFKAVEGYQKLDSGAVKQGFVEAANVSSLNEMTALMLAVRHFESGAQVLRGYDAMLDAAINDLAEF